MQIHIVHINKDSFIFSKIVSQKYDAQIARTPAQVWGLIIGISLIIPYHFAIQSTHHCSGFSHVEKLFLILIV